MVWAKPFRVDITNAVKPTDNALEVDVVNFWPNRLIGDAGLPPEKRLTTTNIRKFTKDSPLMRSGLLGPVTLEMAESYVPLRDSREVLSTTRNSLYDSCTNGH